MHWPHWCVVVGSAALTLVAWHYARTEHAEKVSAQFDRESRHVVDLVEERMRKYEDALWGGVALFDTLEGRIDADEWRTYARSIRIDEKYVGINGIGVIDLVARDDLPTYVADQRTDRPAFSVYPEHEGDVLLPIRWVEPVASNAEAIGLDTAHESNRFTAAMQARDTGRAQITGPIILVQDSDQTPGFLFHAPRYRGGPPDSDAARTGAFEGTVYAPFVVKRLMDGILAKEQRQVSLRLQDAGAILYDELHEGAGDFDADPSHTTSMTVPMYGRTWTFDIWSSPSFDEATSSSEPMVILIAGIIIDTLLVTLFITLTRANRRANDAADLATRQLQERNAELEQFVYTASHDLKSPLLTIQGFIGFIRQDVAEECYDRLDDFSDRISTSVSRMRSSIDDLLELSRVGRVREVREVVDVSAVARRLVEEMRPQLEESGAHVAIQSDLPAVTCDPHRIRQVLQNFLANAIKYGRPDDRPLRIEIGGTANAREVRLFVRDNGPGIDPAFHRKIFDLFERLETKAGGTGVGLAIVKRVAEIHEGRVWVESTPGSGATFVISLPNVPVETLAKVT